MAWAIDGEEPRLWLPGDPVPEEFALADELRAWNAQFERLIYEAIMVPQHGFMPQPFDVWFDTAAEAAAMALPRSLGQAAEVLGLEEQKDDAGHRLMLQMSKPRRPRKGEDPDGIYWYEDEGRLERLYKYCLKDVEVERAVSKRVRRLRASEREVYLLDQEINDRGVQLDLGLIVALKRLATEAQARADARLLELTNGEVASVTKVADMKSWLESQGCELDDLRKQTVAEALDGEELCDLSREVLALRAENAKTSVAKLDAMLACAGLDGRARGLLLYHGAATGRWAGRLIQPQNFPRGSVKDPERFIPRVLENDYDGIESEAPVMEVVSSLLRACFVARSGTRFMGADFSAIEGQVTAWLAGQDGMTSYEDMASAIFGIPSGEIENPSFERHVGKTAVLGCGFGMGWKKFQQTVKDWTGEEIDKETAHRAVSTYRETNYKIKALWYELEQAALRAVKKPYSLQTAGRNGAVRFVVRGEYLWCALPSGRLLAYALPRVEERLAPWGMVEGVTFSGVNGYTRKWERRDLYGGLLTENVVQATARDLMAEAMLRVEQAGYPVVLTVHDEILAEVPHGHGSVEDFSEIMAITPEWGLAIPIKVESWEGERFRK